METSLNAVYLLSQSNDNSFVEQEKRYREKLLEKRIKELTSDNRNYVVIVSEWQEEKQFGRLRKEVGIYLKSFDDAEFEGDVVLAPHLKNFGEDEYQDNSKRLFSAIKPDKTLWKLIGGKKDLRYVEINPETKFNPKIPKLSLSSELSSNPEFFINQIQRCGGIIEENTSYEPLVANRLWLPKREYRWSNATYMPCADLSVGGYITKTWWGELTVAAKPQLRNVAVLFADDRKTSGYETKPSVVKFPDRTTWLFAQNSDEVLQPSGAIILTW